MGTTVINDKDARAAHQLDIVALSPGTGTRNRVIEAIGEAKLREIDCGDLARLDRIRTVLRAAEDARVVLASASGFSNDLIDTAATRSDIRLVG
ncbi:MAG: ATP-binding protein, partial [Candidatus Dormibacteria bacterium]